MVMMRIRTELSGAEGLPGLSTVYANGASSNPVAADALDMVGRVRTFWLALVALMPLGVVMQVSGRVDLIDPTDGELVGGLNPATPAQVSATGSSSLPTATMALLVGNTGVIVRGRRLQGRTFVGPLSATVNNGGSLGPSQATTITNAATAMLTGSTASVPVVWSRQVQTPPAAGSASPVTGYTTRREFAVLRSRRD